MEQHSKRKKEQKIYTYDVPNINIRFDEAIELMKSNNKLLENTGIKKMAVVLDEFEDLLTEDILNNILKELNVTSMKKLVGFDSDCILEKINNSNLFIEEINKWKVNPNKWIRLRSDNDKCQLTIKHIYKKNDKKIQKVKEVEIEVSDLEETNRVLEELGIIRRNYQEKIRYSYIYKTAEIEIDIWPKLEPYMEIECDDENLIDEIISLLAFSSKKIVSLNTEELYKEKGIDILKISDLKF